jgi:hypothetical protein
VDNECNRALRRGRDGLRAVAYADFIVFSTARRRDIDLQAWTEL